MKTILALQISVLVLFLTGVRSYPFSSTNETEYDSAGVEPSSFRDFGDGAFNSTAENDTETDIIPLPQALPLVASDPSNSTAELDEGSGDAADAKDNSDDDYEEEEDDGATSVIEVSKKVIYKLEVVNEDALKNSSVTNIFGDKIKGLEHKNETTAGSNSSDTSLRPSIIFSETLISDTDVSGDPSVIGEKDKEAVDAFYSAGTPAFAKEPGLSDIIKENLGNSDEDEKEEEEGSADETEAKSSIPEDGSLEDSSAISPATDSSGSISSTSDDHESSLHDETSIQRRSAQEYDDNYDTEFDNTTDVSVVASVSSSGDTYNRKIYETVDTDFNGESYSSSSNTEYDPAPQYYGPGSVSGPSNSVEAGHPDFYSSPENEQGETTTQGPYDEEAALIQRQRLAELRRKFLEGESSGDADDIEEEADSSIDYSGDSETETPVLSLLPDAHRAIFY